ncbi:hypothetical protein GCM10011506_09600 [Marivirga lumbricoides]|uniref:Uncharacterized protein n=1 Tax=Marivirga lumbricoides TaxID=1046115 RepID=A0ABQ1LMD4_9BACT|nr:hypothetical protein GCM10011506_09600 [Marivirga lumbricoides]
MVTYYVTSENNSLLITQVYSPPIRIVVYGILLSITLMKPDQETFKLVNYNQKISSERDIPNHQAYKVTYITY